jgi:cytochrome P450
MTVEPEDLIPFGDPDFIADPYPYFERALDRGVAVYLRPEGVAVVLGHPEVSASLRDERLGSVEAFFWPVAEFGDSMIGKDRQDHVRLRRISASWFTSEMVRKWLALAGEHVDRILDRALREGGLDVVADISYVVPFVTTARILGVGWERMDECLKANADVSLVQEPGYTREDELRADAANRWLLDYARELLREERRSTGGGMLADFVAAQKAGLMTEAEVVASVMLFTEVSTADISWLLQYGPWVLLDRPELGDRFRRDVPLRPNMISEVLRLYTPGPAMRRVAVTDVPMGSAVIPAGALTMLMTASANRDPRVFPEPAEYIPDRANVLRQSVAFGGGPHVCLARTLTPALGELVLSRLLERFPGARIEGKVQSDHVGSLRRLKSLPVIV